MDKTGISETFGGTSISRVVPESNTHIGDMQDQANSYHTACIDTYSTY